MEKRRGPSISIKMILATTVLIAVIVVGFGFLQLVNIGRVYDRHLEQEQELIASQLEAQQQAISRIGLATVQTIAASSRTYFEEVGKDGDLRSYIHDLGAKDPQITFVYLLSAEEKLVAHSDPAQNPQEGHKDFADASWNRVKASWSERKNLPGDRQDPLFGQPLGHVGPQGHVALFALPVFPAGTTSSQVKLIFDGAPEERPLAYVILGYSLAAVEAARADAARRVSAAKANQQHDQDKTKRLTAIMGAVFVLIGTLLAILQGLRISKPIKMLAWHADQIARGDLDSRVKVTSSDEIGLLGENFNYMADQLVVLLRQTAEKATLEKELEVARAIQETLVPGADMIDRNFVRIAGYFQPASQCGGDWWTYHDLTDGKVLVVIGDVTGHGVPSAMITAAAKAACDVARAVNNDDVTCEALLEIMNRAIFESARRKFVMTCFASILDPTTRSITYANAGHNFPYLYRENNGQGKFGSLMTRGNRLGDLAESKYAARTMQLQPGDILVWYTDGIVECENIQGEEMGEKRFRAVIRRAAHLEPMEMRELVVASSKEFFGERPRKDDITMVFGKVY